MSGAWIRHARTAWTAADFDLVYVHREASLIGPALLERLAARRRPRLVYDFDDAIWLPYVSPSNRYLSYLKMPGKTRSLCRLATAVTVGNETLAEFARRYNRRVSVVPSTVSLREYRPRPPSLDGATPVIGWTGSHSSAQYLRLIEGPLRALGARRRFRFRIVGLEGYRIDGLEVDCRPWRAETEVEDLWGMDIGVMPLADDPWARGKCGMKAIQYMGVGLPVVVSPVGVNRSIVEDGVNGFHATDETQWVECIGRLLDDPGLRTRLGARARRTVETNYSAEVQAPRVAAVIGNLL
jgi:glycosyltransferase involved in cell wall biosynthesis